MALKTCMLRTVLIAAGLTAFGAALPAPAASEAWYYTLGVLRANQQGNFCLTRGDVTELAGIFRKYGVRPGFAALSSSPNCEIRVDSFTPREVIERVDVVTKNGIYEYTIRFVRVEIRGGADSFLITTREVRVAR